jgi:V8-like Glu-specific endopeptidase
MKTILKSLCLAICLILLGNFSHSGTIDPNTPDEKYIAYGKKFTYIYQICGSNKDKSMFYGSAVAIGSHWAVTAAHVVKDSNICLLHHKESDSAFFVDKIFIHENYDDTRFGKADIALLYTEKDLGLDFYPELYDDNNEINKICCISGYGMTGTFITGVTKSDDYRRAGSNKIDDINSDLLICSASKDKRTELEFLICSGDSGGGLFIDNKLAGINSCVLASDKKPNSTYGDESGHTRISKFTNWIRKIMTTKIER